MLFNAIIKKFTGQGYNLWQLKFTAFAIKKINLKHKWTINQGIYMLLI